MCPIQVADPIRLTSGQERAIDFPIRTIRLTLLNLRRVPGRGGLRDAVGSRMCQRGRVTGALDGDIHGSSGGG